MEIYIFDPTSSSGQGGYLNYKMSGGGSNSNSGGSGCGMWLWIVIVLLFLALLGQS